MYAKLTNPCMVQNTQINIKTDTPKLYSFLSFWELIYLDTMHYYLQAFNKVLIRKKVSAQLK